MFGSEGTYKHYNKLVKKLQIRDIKALYNTSNFFGEIQMIIYFSIYVIHFLFISIIRV